MDHFSPVAPAHIRVLVLPVGDIERLRFLRVLHRLQTEANVIPLADVKQQTDSHGVFLSPKTFPQGCLLYRYCSAAAPEQHQVLSPFELFREPLLVLGVVDGLSDDAESSRKELGHAVAYLKERHPRVVRRQLIVLDDREDNSAWEHVKAVGIANADTSNDAALRAAIYDISDRFLVDFTTYAKATQASPTILTPGQTARSLQKPTSLRDEEEERPGSGRSTPPRAGRISSPIDDGSAGRPPSKVPPLPATSFDQIPSVTNPHGSVSRPDSRTGNKGKSGKRSSSQDRVSVQGFGSSASQEKIRMRGKARVGIVLGSIYMTAGQWRKALPILVEHTTNSRSLQDHLWYAKGLENLLVCMLLLAWSGVDFQIPSICEPVTDRSGPTHAARIAAETKAAAEGTKQQLQLFRLSVAVPDLSRMILSLYRSTEGSLELPIIVVAEATVRMAKLLAILGNVKGQFSSSGLRQVVIPHASGQVEALGVEALPAMSPTISKAKLSKTAIADLLAEALPSTGDGVTVGDHIRLLAGIASTYALLRLDRKRAITIKDLVARLTGALIQARKVGAAEMGIHPAASLSTDTGADTILSVLEESNGIGNLMADVSKAYGANLALASPADQPKYFDTRAFGSSSLRFDLLRELAGFCEASPDPHGALLLITSLLRAAGPNAAIDIAPGSVHATNAFSKEEQMHLATVIHRTVTISRHLGLTDVQATYWDPFLLRDIEILQPSGHKAVIDRSKISKMDSNLEQTSPGNPLLYDPNASRPGTAEKQIFLLVENEASECIIRLQNPFDIPVDIEELELITDGVELSSHHEPVTLGPLRFQHVSLTVMPRSVGPTKITGCRIKMQGCRSQVFPIVEQAWSAKASLTIKDQGLKARATANEAIGHYELKSIGLEPATVSVSIIETLPTLSLESSSILESGLMLLEGERRPLALTFRNTGTIAASIFEIKDTGDILHHIDHRGSGQLEPNAELSATIVQPTESVTFHFQIEGKAGVSHTQAAFYYSSSGFEVTKYARVTTVLLDITVNAALQIQNLEVAKWANRAGEDSHNSLLVSFDVRNAWPKPIFFECLADGSNFLNDLPGREGSLAPGELRRVNVLVPRARGKFVEVADAVKAQFLDGLKVLWRMDDRSGAADLQSLSLSAESLSLLRGAPIKLEISAATSSGDKGHEFTVGSFVSIRIRLVNRSKRSDPLLVSLSTDAGRSVAVVGTLQHQLSPLAEGEERQIEMVLCPLLTGALHLEAVVRPMAATHGSGLGPGPDSTEKALLSLSIE